MYQSAKKCDFEKPNFFPLVTKFAFRIQPISFLGQNCYYFVPKRQE